MNVVRCVESNLQKGLYIVDIKCERCGHVGTVKVDKISELHHCICTQCGFVNVEYKDGKLYKDTRKLGRGLSDIKDKTVLRVGLERLIRTYMKLKRTGFIDERAFEDKEDFLAWSIENGYRDWKVLRSKEENGLIDREARWVSSKYGVSDCESASVTEQQGKILTAKAFGMAIETSKESIEKALNTVKIEKEKWSGLESKSGTKELERRLKRVMTELDSISEQLDKEFV